jgi:hypothetical protein
MWIQVPISSLHYLPTMLCRVLKVVCKLYFDISEDLTASNINHHLDDGDSKNELKTQQKRYKYVL